MTITSLKSPTIAATLIAAILFVFSVCTVSSVSAQKEEIGYNALVALIGPGLETGANIKISQIEANEGNPNLGEFEYLADSANPQFAGKTIVDGSGFSTAPSGHATGTVGQFIYGNTSSIAPGVTDITGYEVVDWLSRVLGSPTFGAPNIDPLVENFRVSNHSWVARSGITDADSENIMQRLDFYINQNETTVVVGADNRTALPKLLTQGYNSISVGRSSGNHSFGATNLYGNGRIKPDIVSPNNTTSRATAVVSAAASLLHEKADNLGSFDARRSEVVKSILMAGATKNDVNGTWNRTTTQPLDTQFGAGELNILNSYLIMDAGEFDGQVGEPTSAVDLMGWDYGENLDGGDSLYYEFEVGLGGAVDASILTTWNMQVVDIDPGASFDPSFQLADLQLNLYNSTNGFMDTLVDSSLSSVDNVEHIYQLFLAEGTYTIEITNDSGFSSDFGLAWRIRQIPEPTSALFGLALLAGAFSVSRRRR